MSNARRFSVTTWDSLTGEAHTAEVMIDANFATDRDEIVLAIHEAVCMESGEEADSWTFGGGQWGGTKGPHLNFVSMWLASDGTISSESARELTLNPLARAVAAKPH